MFSFLLFGNYYIVILIIPAYFLSIIVVLAIISKRKEKYSPFPRIKVTSFGLSFFSQRRHRIKIDNILVFQLNNMVYLKPKKLDGNQERLLLYKKKMYEKNKNKLVIIKNIDNLREKNGYLYFQALGNVEIYLDTAKIYKYFNISIKSTYFDFKSLQSRAILSIMDNLIDITNATYLVEYMRFIKLLNIEIQEDKIVVGKNRLRLDYSLIYKCNNKIKKINIQY